MREGRRVEAETRCEGDQDFDTKESGCPFCERRDREMGDSVHPEMRQLLQHMDETGGEARGPEGTWTQGADELPQGCPALPCTIPAAASTKHTRGGLRRPRDPREETAFTHSSKPCPEASGYPHPSPNLRAEGAVL